RSRLRGRRQPDPGTAAGRRKLRQGVQSGQDRRSARQEEAAGDRAAAGGYERDLAVGHLSRAARAAQLADRLGEKPEAVQATARELPAPGVERQLAPQTNAARGDEGSAFATLAEAECLDPREREPAEAVVELEGADVGRADVGARPELLSGVTRRPRRQFLPLIPDRPRAHGAAVRVDADGCRRRVAGDGGAG